jgi:DNA mismatch repair protein MutS2
MNEKSAQILELPKILEQLARFASFSVGEDYIRTLAPTADLEQAREWQSETSEARKLIEVKTEISMGGARDVRAASMQATRGLMLDPSTLLDIRGTLRRASQMKRTITRLTGQYPRLSDIAERLEELPDLQGKISAILSDNGEILDTASAKLAIIRRDLRIAFDRLQTRLNNIINNPNNQRFLQEVLITMRNGRYVIPLRAEARGRIEGILHDQSSSGATIFIEPTVTVELNNAWRELQLAEEDEIRKILTAISRDVGDDSEQIVATVETLGYLDMTFAKARYAVSIRASEPKLVHFRKGHHNIKNPGSVIKLEQARHPLLPSLKVVPTDITLDDDTYMLVITGPNTGGKTVALKTVGLLVLMAQAGLQIPAEPGAQLTVFRDVFADIGDEQSIEQSLSTFSGHITNTIRILDQADDQCLVILDELGAGTDPTEGSALARAILNFLLGKGITTFITSHHPELRAYGHERKGVRNASVEFDLQTLAPTYRLIIGIPGRSNALAIATRLGLSGDIIADAQQMVGTDEKIAENLLDEIQRTREETRKAKELALQATRRAEEYELEIRKRAEAIEQERKDILNEARKLADREIAAIQNEVRHLKSGLRAAAQPLEAIKKVEAAMADLKDQAATNVAALTGSVVVPSAEEARPSFKLGETVWIPRLNTEGEIMELTNHDAEVAIGRLRVRAKFDEMSKRARAETTGRKRGTRDANVPTFAEKTAKASTVAEAAASVRPRGVSPGLELDLRGLRIDDGLTQLENYLDAAYMAGLPFVRIIHGKGTGAMRKAIRDTLAHHSLVSHYESGGDKEGGDGVTVVNLSPHV